MSICSTPLVFSLWAILPEDTTKLHCSQRNQEETLISNRSTQRRWSTQSKDTKITTCSTPFHLAISSGDLLQPFTNQFIANRRLNNCQAPNRKKNIVSYLLYKITSKHLPPTPQLSSQSQKTWNFIKKKTVFWAPEFEEVVLWTTPVIESITDRAKLGAVHALNFAMS